MIEAKNLVKRFKSFTAVDNVSLNIQKGQIFGLLGPNAAGKTTVIRMLCGILESDEGIATINGKNIQQAKSDFGYVAQYFSLYEELSVWENLSFYAQMYNISDHSHLASLLEKYQLMPFRNRLAGQLSGGFKRRLALVCALAHDPMVLFLDEPTAGIDPVTRKLLWDDFYQLSAEGKTLFVTTHYMEEAQRCHQLAFISAGKLVAEGTPITIKKAIGSAQVYTTQTPYRPDIHQALLHLKGVILVNQFGDELRLMVEQSVDPSSLKTVINKTLGGTCELALTEANLEDVFIAITQNKVSI